PNCAMFGSAYVPGSTGLPICLACTVHVRDDPSGPVTVYSTGCVKSCTEPLSGVTVARGETASTGASAVTSVPGSTASVTVELAPSTIAGTLSESSSAPVTAVWSAPSWYTSSAVSARS